jgi:dihydroflavonol-4-reductase
MIFLSGASGFLGAYILARLLKAGKYVRALKKPHSDMLTLNRAFQFTKTNLKLLETNTEWIESTSFEDDLSDIITPDIREIYHCAGLVSYDKKDKNALFRSNYILTQKLVNEALKKGISRFHYVSSIAALNRNVTEMIDESYPQSDLKGMSNYARSKLAGEWEVMRAYAEGLSGVIINPGLILGVGDFNRGSIRLIKQVIQGLKYYVKGMNGFVDVRDVADFFYSLAADPAFYGERYILVSENLRYKDIFEMIAKEMHIASPQKEASELLSRIIAKTEQWKSFLFGGRAFITDELVDIINSSYKYSNQKVRNTLKKDFIPLQESITDICTYVKTEHIEL